MLQKPHFKGIIKKGGDITMKQQMTAEQQRQIVSKNLNALLSKTNRKKVDVANHLQKYGVSETTVYSWFNGKKYPRIDKIQLLADYFGVLKSDITEEKNDSKKEFISSTLQLPLYGSIAAGALASVDVVTQDDVEYISVPSQFLGKYSNCTRLFSMVVNGDSMNKVIQHGSIVVAKPLELDQYKDGDIVIFSYNNEYSLKRFSPNALDGYILFKSESTDSYFKDIPVPFDAINELKIYGKVVFYGNTL